MCLRRLKSMQPVATAPEAARGRFQITSRNTPRDGDLTLECSDRFTEVSRTSLPVPRLADKNLKTVLLAHLSDWSILKKLAQNAHVFVRIDLENHL